MRSFLILVLVARQGEQHLWQLQWSHVIQSVLLLLLETVRIASGREIANYCSGCWSIKLQKESEEEEVQRY